MSERGVFAMDRGWFDHPTFADEPFTEREAWAWLIAQAAYRPYRRRVGSTIVDLECGQLAHSLRFMADKWQWSDSRVRRFLARLKASDAMIDTSSGGAITVITISNYSKYQRVSLPIDAAIEPDTDAAATQQRRKEENNKNPKQVSDGGSAPTLSVDQAKLESPLVSAEASSLAEELAAIAGHADPKSWPPGWCGSVMRVQAMLNEGWNPNVIRSAVQAAASRKRDGPANSLNYFEAAIARAHINSPALPSIDQGPNDAGVQNSNGFRPGPRGRGFASLAFERAASSGEA